MASERVRSAPDETLRNSVDAQGASLPAEVVTAPTATTVLASQLSIAAHVRGTFRLTKQSFVRLCKDSTQLC